MKPIEKTRTVRHVGAVEPRTLLFSDIEGSTKLLAGLGEEYPRVLGTYRAIIREAISAHNGTEQSTGGDGFFAIFLSAPDGLAAAIDAQRALRAIEWPSGSELRVRMGLHTGDIGRADGDVVGLAIHEAARIADAAHGGQVLVSPRICELTAGARPEGLTFRTLGRHRLKDLPESVKLFQALHPALPGDFPPPRSRDVVVDLPLPRASFVGREREVAGGCV